MNEMNKRETLCDYFDEDVVIKWSPNGKLIFGLVIESSENATDSEDEESDDDSDGNKQLSNTDKWRRLRPGFAKIALYPNGNTVVVNESKVKLYDRSLLNGDVVQRLDPITHKLVPNSEHGFCKSTKIMATIRILGTNKVIENVDSNDLELLYNISEDTICLLDSWLGYVKEINKKITLKCMDGSLLTISDKDIIDFDDLLTQSENEDSEFNRDDHYIGQQLYGYKKDLKNGVWISQSKRMKNYMDSSCAKNSKINVVVENVTIDAISINWLCCLSDENLPKNCETINHLISNKNSAKKHFRGNQSNNGSHHPIGDVIRGEAIERIKCLNHFGKCSLELTHFCYYTIKPNDSVITFSEWMSKESLRLLDQNKSEDISESEMETSDEDSAVQINESLSSLDSGPKHDKKKKCNSVSVRKVKKKKLYASNRKPECNLPIKTTVGSRLPIEIVATKTRVTVVWQSSIIEEDVPSINLYPVHHIDNHDFFPGDYVVENKEISESYDYGVVQSCDAISRTTVVKWFSVVPDSQSAQFVAQQELSVYDIRDHPDFSFRSGVCVVRMLSVTDEYVCDPASRVGQVIDLTSDGMLRCIWLNGQTSVVWPQQLFIAGDYDSDDLWGESDSEFDYSDYTYYESDKSWETDGNEVKDTDNNSPKNCSDITEQTQSLLGLVRSGVSQLEEWMKNGTGNYRNNWQQLKALKKVENSLEIGNQSLNQFNSKIQDLTRRLKQFIPFFRSAQNNAIQCNHNNCKESIKTILDSNVPQNSSSSSLDTDLQTFTELLNVLKTEVLSKETKNQTTNGETIDERSDENQMKESPQTNQLIEINGSEGKGSVIFVESVPECHKYFNSLIEPKNPKEFLKRTRFEISLLKNALPEGIDVVLFHDRIDLLSVLISGPKDTPYEDGLFVFDVQLPANYPNGPPIVHYISFCSDRLNPNLYENGKVCVSLLGTWSGKGTEVWAPNTSNLLQVIISIQGLILVPEPYYNEAGYGKQRGTTIANDNSRLYNEMVVIKLIQTMTNMLLNPPKAFENKIREHILGMADNFIERNKNWAQISRICFSKSITSSEELKNCEELTKDFGLPAFPLLPASQGFCLSLDNAILTFEKCLKTQI